MDRAVSKEPPFGMWDLRFESRFLQRGVCELSVRCGVSNFRFGSPAARWRLAGPVQPESNMRPRSTPRVLPAQTDPGFAPLSPTSEGRTIGGRSGELRNGAFPDSRSPSYSESSGASHTLLQRRAEPWYLNRRRQHGNFGSQTGEGEKRWLETG